MAQLLVRNLDETTKERLRKRAALNGRSMEAEARLILKRALEKPIVQHEKGLGTMIAEMFEGVGMDFEIPEYTTEEWGLFEFDADESRDTSENTTDRQSA